MPPIHAAHVAAVVICAGLAAMQQPREATAALVSYLAIALAIGRRVALVACVAIGLGLIAASPTGGLITPQTNKETGHDRAPQPRHTRDRP